MKVAMAVFCAVMAMDVPSGRPPTGPLQRVEPRVYDFNFNVTVSTVWQQDVTQRRRYRLEDAPIVFPVIFQGAYSRVPSESLWAKLWLEGREDQTLSQRTRVDSGFPHHSHLAVLTVPRFGGYSLRWRLGYRVQVWSSRINDAEAAQIAWPREWPKEVQDGLQRQMYIESDNTVFAETVAKISQGQLRMVPPYLAAKDIVRYCINNMRLSGDGVNRGNGGMLHGLEIVGATRAAATGVGGPHDLVCLCVAMLQAAGIPARPVIGVEEDETDREVFVSWAEFYLPGAGWIPFDPVEMRGKGIRHLNVRQPWPEFGTMDDLNRRIPLAYHFVPPAAVEAPQTAAVWGWDPRPGRDPSSEQIIVMSIISRGRGVDDAR